MAMASGQHGDYRRRNRLFRQPPLLSFPLVKIDLFFFKQKTAYEIGLGIPAEPLFRSEARINLSRFVVTGCAAKTSATVTFPSLNLISLFAFCFNIWLNGVAS